MFRLLSSLKAFVWWGVFFSILSYLIFHLLEGRLGMRAWRSLSQRFVCLEKRVEMLRVHEEALKVRSNLLKGGVDHDLLEEQVGLQLGYVRPGDDVFLDKSVK